MGSSSGFGLGGAVDTVRRTGAETERTARVDSVDLQNAHLVALDNGSGELEVGGRLATKGFPPAS